MRKTPCQKVVTFLFGFQTRDLRERRVNPPRRAGYLWRSRTTAQEWTAIPAPTSSHLFSAPRGRERAQDWACLPPAQLLNTMAGGSALKVQLDKELFSKFFCRPSCR